MDFEQLTALAQQAPKWTVGNLLPEYRPFYEAARLMLPLLIAEIEASRWCWEHLSYTESNERLQRAQADVEQAMAEL